MFIVCSYLAYNLWLNNIIRISQKICQDVQVPKNQGHKNTCKLGEENCSAIKLAGEPEVKD